MGDHLSLVLAVAALAAAVIHALWVSKRYIDHRVAGSVVVRLLGKGATKLCRAADASSFFVSLRASLLEVAAMRAEAPSMIAGSYREQPGRRDEARVEASLGDTFERHLAVEERDLARRRALALVAASSGVASVWRALATSALSAPLPLAIAGLAIVVAAWYAVRSWQIPRDSRREIAGILPLLARCAIDGERAPEAKPSPPRGESSAQSAAQHTPVTSWPEEHGVFYAFDDERCGVAHARITALLADRLAGQRLRVADLARLGGAASSRPARLLAVLGDRESVAAYTAEIARRSEEGDDPGVPDALCASEPVGGGDVSASFSARRAYFDVRAAVATGEYEVLRVTEPTA